MQFPLLALNLLLDAIDIEWNYYFNRGKIFAWVYVFYFLKFINFSPLRYQTNNPDFIGLKNLLNTR